MVKTTVNMKKFYFTFGNGQKHEGCFTIIEARTRQEARDRMVIKFGLMWAFQYDKHSWFDRNGISQEELYKLKKI